MDKNIRKPGRTYLADVLDSNKRQTQLETNCVKIGTIETFDPSNQRARVKIAYKQVKDILEDGTHVYEEYPLLMDVPVFVLFGGVDILTMPISPGDSCIVLFNDDEMGQWAKSGGGFPVNFVMHDLSYAIALVGIRPLSNVITNYLANGIRLSHGGGNSQMDLKDNLIETIATLFLHNGNAEVTGDTLIRGNLTVLGNITGGSGSGSLTINGDAQINGQLYTTDNDGTIHYNTHTHGGVMPGGGDTDEPNKA